MTVIEKAISQKEKEIVELEKLLRNPNISRKSFAEASWDLMQAKSSLNFYNKAKTL